VLVTDDCITSTGVVEGNEGERRFPKSLSSGLKHRGTYPKEPRGFYWAKPPKEPPKPAPETNTEFNPICFLFH